ncbi:uncharacterized protein LOC123306698 [Coccinella septempunctata]|uniref:uncharacterized protein LOC123306698 n=1 Tax=Coccinella septempunctata TaxID=41139 RepID=UPI001D081D1B|nr:uncharacterized protein LOC123306698 [Coccinella septempunctata]
MDTLVPVLKNIFLDSKIAQSIKLKRSKATALVTESLGHNFLKILFNNLKIPGNFFSLIKDETTDISVKKQCAFTVIYFSSEEKIITQFFDLVETKGSTAQELFDVLKGSLDTRQIPLQNLVGFSSDTTNVMVGEHQSVFAHLKKCLPYIVCVKCSCHMAHLAASRACLVLPKHVEDMLRNIGSHFSRSSSRRQKYEEFQIFFKVDIHKILSPSNTRWLSVKACVDRLLEQYEALLGYFRENVYEDPSYITEAILETMSNPYTKVYLELMVQVLGLITEFNMIFQSEKQLLYELKLETKKLLSTLASYYLKMPVVTI